MWFVECEKCVCRVLSSSLQRAILDDFFLPQKAVSQDYPKQEKKSQKEDKKEDKPRLVVCRKGDIAYD